MSSIRDRAPTAMSTPMPVPMQTKTTFSVDSRLQTFGWMAFVAVLSYLAANLGGTVVVKPQADWPLWPGNVLLVTILLLLPRRIWLLLIGAALASFALFNVRAGLSAQSIIWLQLSDIAEVGTAAFGLNYVFPDGIRFDSVKALGKYAIVAVFLAPFAGAFFGAAATSGNYWISWRISFLSEALAFLTLLPAIFGWVTKAASPLRESAAYRAEAVVIFIAFVIVGYLTFVSPLTLVGPALPLVPLLLWAALRFGPTGVSSAMIILGFLSIWGAIHGRGPFVSMGPVKNVDSIQAFLLFAAAPFMLLASLVQERKNAGEDLRKSEQRFSAAFRRSPLSLALTTARDHKYLDVNETFEKLSGYTRAEAVGRSAVELGVWADPDERVRFIDLLHQQGSLREVECEFRTKDGRTLIGLASAELIDIDGQPCALTVTADITSRKQAEQSLAESERRFRLLANTAPVMIWSSTPDKRCDYFNQPWLDFTGRPLSFELGDGWTAGVHPQDLNRCVDTYRTAFDARQPFKMQYRLRRHDGEHRWILDVGVPRFNGDGSFAGYIGSCLDITDSKLAAEALSMVGRKLIEAQEQERSRIARELHDDINQRLALLANGLQEFEQATASDRYPSRTQPLHALWQLTGEIAADIQQLSHQLHPSKLHYLGLAAAVRDLCKDFSKQQKIDANCSIRDLPADIDETTSLSLFRTTQEALHNVSKHSRARHVKVDLTGTLGFVELRVTDDGVGFDPELARHHHGLGLVSMRERMKSVGGDLTVSSMPSRGTEIKAIAPAGPRPQHGTIGSAAD